MMIHETHPFATRRRKHSLFAHVVEELGSRIVRGDYEPGATVLNEADLGREFQASRSVIREAVKSLAAKGLLEAKTRSGTRVLPATSWNLLDLDVLAWRYNAMPPQQFFRELFEIRSMIEPAAAAFAAERATEQEIELIAEAYRAMCATEQASQAAIDADLQFHRAILAAGHNNLMSQLGGVIGVGLLISFRLSSATYAVFLKRHGKVLDAIRDRKPAKAREAMNDLVTETRVFLERELAGASGRKRPAARRQSRE
jgi:DNA-binding FadR family transcriptional regulator